MNNIAVAFIDDGININLFKEFKNISTYEVLNHKIVQYVENKEEYTLTHASLCLKIFLKYNKKHLNIISIKVLNEKKICDVEDLILALNWVKDKNIKIVNMSLGTSFFSDKNILKHCINKLANKGIIIVAAHNNYNVETYPASFFNVIGVKASSDDKELYVNTNYDMDGIEFCAKSVHTVYYLDHNMSTSNSNSFSAPYVTALVVNIVDSTGINLWNVKKELSKLCGVYDIRKRDFDWCQKAIIFCSKNEIMNDKYFYFNVKKTLFFETLDVEKLEPEISNLKKDVDTIIIIDKQKQFNHYKLIEKIKIPNTLVLSNHIFVGEKNNNYMQVPYINNLSNMRNLNYNQIDIPLIIVYYKKNYLSNLSVVLVKCQELFINDGYGCRCFMDNSIGILYGFDNIESLKYICECSEFYSADLLIVAFDYDENYAQMESDTSFIFCNKKDKNDYLGIEKINTVKSLYEKIIDDFT